jgi:3-methyladenine DNA glycosylase AlkC
MPEPLKNLYNKQMLSALSREITIQYAAFDPAAFERSIIDTSWKQKELKQRMRHIAECLQQHLPPEYPRAIAILKPVAEKFNGFEYMFFQHSFSG